MPVKSLKPLNKYVMASVFACTIGGFLFAGYLPLYLKNQALQHEINDRQEEINSIQQQTKLLNETARRISLISTQVKNYDRLVPDTQELGPFLAQLSHQLDQAGMKDTAVRAMAPNLLAKCVELPIAIKGTGTFTQIYQFMKNLETLSRMSSVSHVSIEAASNMTGMVSFDLTLSIYNTKSQDSPDNR